MNQVELLLKESKKLSNRLNKIEFSEPVAFVYNPWHYAWECHADYLKKYGKGKKKILLMGMNPGPFGMAQTGVPFGEIAAARDYLKIKGKLRIPRKTHPKRPIQGFECPRSEVSGRRLWGYFSSLYPNAKDFFKDYFVLNYCPLAFLGETGKNITPDKLLKKEREEIQFLCDEYLRKVTQIFQPQYLLGVGAYAEKAFQRAAGDSFDGVISKILHPSPASPSANRGWAEQVERQLQEIVV